MCPWLQELDRVQQLWQQQADQTVAQQYTGQHTGRQQEAPVRQLKQLMQQHKQELALKVCQSVTARSGCNVASTHHTLCTPTSFYRVYRIRTQLLAQNAAAPMPAMSLTVVLLLHRCLHSMRRSRYSCSSSRQTCRP